MKNFITVTRTQDNQQIELAVSSISKLETFPCDTTFITLNTKNESSYPTTLMVKESISFLQGKIATINALTVELVLN